MIHQRRPLRYALCMLALAALLAAARVADACPNCKQLLADPDTPAQMDAGVPNGDEAAPVAQGDLGAGFYYSILLMLSMPLLVAAGLGTMFYVVLRKAPPVLPQQSQA